MAKSAHIHRSSLLGLGLSAHDKPTSLVEKCVLVSAALVYGRKKDKQVKKKKNERRHERESINIF